jgi:hypothetical protein
LIGHSSSWSSNSTRLPGGRSSQRNRGSNKYESPLPLPYMNCNRSFDAFCKKLISCTVARWRFENCARRAWKSGNTSEIVTWSDWYLTISPSIGFRMAIDLSSNGPKLSFTVMFSQALRFLSNCPLYEVPGSSNSVEDLSDDSRVSQQALTVPHLVAPGLTKALQHSGAHSAAPSEHGCSETI